MVTRREVVRTAGAVSFATLGGCSALPTDGGTPDGGDGSAGRSYASWTPAVDDPNLTFSFERPAALAAIDGPPAGEIVNSTFGLDAGTIDAWLSTTAGTVVEGSFDVETLRAGVERALGVQMRADGRYGGYDRYAYERRGTSQVAGFADGRAVTSASDHFERLVDVRNGDADALEDANQEFSLLADAIGGVHLAFGSVVLDTEARGDHASGGLANGKGYVVGPDRTRATSVQVLESADAVDESAVRESLRLSESATGLTVSSSGRVVTAEWKLSTDRIVAWNN